MGRVVWLLLKPVIEPKTRDKIAKEGGKGREGGWGGMENHPFSLKKFTDEEKLVRGQKFSRKRRTLICIYKGMKFRSYVNKI